MINRKLLKTNRWFDEEFLQARMTTPVSMAVVAVMVGAMMRDFLGKTMMFLEATSSGTINEMICRVR